MFDHLRICFDLDSAVIDLERLLMSNTTKNSRALMWRSQLIIQKLCVQTTAELGSHQINKVAIITTRGGIKWQLEDVMMKDEK